MTFNRNENENNSLLLNKLRQKVFAVVKNRVFLKEDADEITQDVLLKVISVISKRSDSFLSTEDEILKYVVKMAINEVGLFYRSNANQTFIDEEELLNLESKKLNAEEGLIILQSLAKLPIKQRLIFFLQDKFITNTLIFHFSLKTISETLEMSEQKLVLILDKIPFNDDEIKPIIEEMTNKKLKTSVRDERWKGRKFLRKFLFRD